MNYVDGKRTSFMKKIKLIVLILFVVNTCVYAVSPINLNASTNPSKKLTIKKDTTKVKAMTLTDRKVLRGAVITTRNCADREFIVSARDGVIYRVYFNRINGQYAQSSGDQMRLCNRNNQGYQAGNRINVNGQYQLRNRQHIIYNATLSN